jgi:hypothetical protein
MPWGQKVALENHDAVFQCADSDMLSTTAFREILPFTEIFGFGN